MNWKPSKARSKLSEVIRRALTEGPQRIERRNDAVVLVDAKEYERLAGAKASFVNFLQNAPDVSVLDPERNRSALREVEL